MKAAALAVILAILLVLAPIASTSNRRPEPIEQQIAEAIQAQQAQQNFREKLSKATLAIYMGKNICAYRSVETIFGPLQIWGCEFEYRFICTGTVIKREDEVTYGGLTAGHCFDWKAQEKGISYYVADTVKRKPVLKKIEVVKFANDERYDYGLFEFHSLTEYPVIPVYFGPGLGVPQVGIHVWNSNFALGIAKQTIDGTVVSPLINGDFENLNGRYLVTLPTGPGSSGSPVVVPEVGMIVGIVEVGFPETQMGVGVMPLGDNLKSFIEDDSAGLRPDPAPEQGPTQSVEETLKGIFRTLWHILTLPLRLW